MGVEVEQVIHVVVEIGQELVGTHAKQRAVVICCMIVVRS